jgi:Protein of unknown function (DUF3866)
MAFWRTGTIVRIVSRRPGLVRAVVETGGSSIDAVGYPEMLGEVVVGDEVVVNVTGLELGLGTGGVGFLLWTLGSAVPDRERGHIVKLRYTPWQMNVLAAEEPEGSHHDVLEASESIAGVPVVACGLHSQVAGAAAGIKAHAPHARVGYLMSDGGALALRFSDLVAEMGEAGLVDVTCTYGHAFGGDLEAVNVFSGLAALALGERVDAVIAALGPGLAGTGTRLGFTGLEQGQMLDAATALGGRAVACLRISFSDPRPRHRGVSHHSLTALRVAARERCTVAVPELTTERAIEVRNALDASGVSTRHSLVCVSGAPGCDLLRARGIEPASMGRAMADDPEPHLAAAAAGRVAAELLP